MSYTKTPKNAKKYICEKCDFACSKKSDFNRHLMTAKHKMMTNSDKISYKNAENAAAYICDCGKSYKYRQGLSLHKKKCIQKTPENEEKTQDPENIVHESITDTTLLKCFQTMMETQSNAMQMQLTQSAAQSAAQAAAIEQAAVIQAKRDEAAAEQTKLLIEAITLNGTKTIMNNSNNNTTNNQFNLNVFLNEDCKDAYTLKEVMDSIECTVTDLDRMDHDGYVATITRKILESIQDMDITERPIHCTDARRNTVCVKNETGWEKNEKAMKLLANSVLLIGRKLGRMVDDWRLVYPDHFRGTVTRREQYHRLIADIMKVNDLDVEARIASKICKSIVLDRKAVMER